MLTVNFYARHAFPGWRKWAWLPVRWMTGKFVHVDITICGETHTADMRRGTARVQHGLVPTTHLAVDCRTTAALAALSQLRGQAYDWRAFWTVWLPRIFQRDGAGMICSEHAAWAIIYALRDNPEPWAQGIAQAVFAAEPSRLTPQALYDLLHRAQDFAERHDQGAA